MALVELSATVISTNRYAPSGSDAVKLYNYNGAENLTLAQLVSAVCVRRSAQVEDQMVGVMNQMTNTSDMLERLSNEVNEMVAISIPGEDSDWAARKKRLVAMGCSGIDDVNDITSYTNRLKVYEAVQKRMEELNAISERTGIELQTCSSRRDAVYTLATTTTTHLGSSLAQAANALKR